MAALSAPSSSSLQAAAALGGAELIAFVDVETSAPEPRLLLEIGVVLVCPRKLVEIAQLSSLVRPRDPSVVSASTTRRNGITRDAVNDAPPFQDVAGAFYDHLHGRVWAGHNIERFHYAVIREAFTEIGLPPPVPTRMIDTLPLLTRRLGRRAGNMKMESLSHYFGLGRQRHRSLDDIRLNIEVLKYCATVLFLEEETKNVEMPTMQVEANYSRDYSVIVEANDVSEECIKIKVELLGHKFGPKTVIQHKDAPLQLKCADSKVRFGVLPKYEDNAGRPKLNFLVDIPENVYRVLGFCDDLAQRSSPEGMGTSEWRPLIKRYRNANCPSVRLNIPTDSRGDVVVYLTDIYLKERNGVSQKLVLNKVDAVELDYLLRGNKVDAFFSLEVYYYQHYAGIRLVAKRLDVHLKIHQAPFLE